MTIEASIAIATGYITRSVSLQGFGIDSVIELIAGGILLWRLLVEQRGATTDAIERAEKRAAWVTAFSLFALAIYIVVDSTFALIIQSRPEASWWGIGLAIAAAIFMPVLWQGKLRVARRIGSAALPNAGTTRFYVENIENHRSDTVPIVDFRLDKAFRVGKYRFTGMFDLFNAANTNAVTNFILTNGSTFNKIIATIDPRTAQVGIRFDF